VPLIFNTRACISEIDPQSALGEHSVGVDVVMWRSSRCTHSCKRTEGRKILIRSKQCHVRKDYISRVAKVMSMATKTRSDLMFTVSTLAFRSSDSYEADVKLVKPLNHLYEYLNTLILTEILRWSSDAPIRSCQHRLMRPMISIEIPKATGLVIGGSSVPSLHQTKDSVYLCDAG
jgi:hypothetical protein